MQRLFEVFEAHNIRYFFYAGGNDSQDTADKISKLAQQKGYELRVIGIPKTIDNDLPVTDHCPGYGSVIKFNATTVTEVAIDVGGMATDDGSCCIIEVMGRHAGWIACFSGIATAADYTLIPEEEANIDEMCKVLLARRKAGKKYGIVIVSEGVTLPDAGFVTTAAEVDDFGSS